MKERLAAMRKAFDKQVKEKEAAKAKLVGRLWYEVTSSDCSLGPRPI